MAVIVRTFEEAGQRLTLRDLGTHHELLLIEELRPAKGKPLKPKRK